MSWRPGEPRFLVREVDGYSGGNTRLLLSVSDAREAIRNRAAGLAAMLEAECAA